MTFNVQIFDNHRNHIADFMNATVDDVMKYLNKGLIVVNLLTGQELREEDLVNMIGVSDSVISLG